MRRVAGLQLRIEKEDKVAAAKTMFVGKDVFDALSKRFCLFSAQYFPTVGGVEKYTHSLAICLRSQGHEVAVITSAQAGLPDCETTEEGIIVYRLPSWQLMNGRLPVVKPGAALRRMGRQLAQTRWDGAVIQTRFYPLSLWAAHFTARQNIPTIVIEHGSAHLAFSNKWIQQVGNDYEHGITACLKRYCKHFYGVSQAANAWLTHFGIVSEGVLYNAVDEEQIAQIRATHSSHLRRTHGIDENTTVIAFVGRLVEEKGILSLLSAVQRLLAQGENVHLLIAGDGPLRSTVDSARSAHITPLGMLSFQGVVQCLSESDIFCLPSRSEGFCTSVLEAIACDCVVAATCVGGVDILIEDGVSGVLLQGVDEDNVYQGLKRTLCKEQRPMMIENSRRKVDECGCHWKNTTEKIVQIFAQLQQKEGKTP